MMKQRLTYFTATVLALSVLVSSFSVVHIHELEPAPEQVSIQTAHIEAAHPCALCWTATVLGNAELTVPFVLQLLVSASLVSLASSSTGFFSRIIMLASLRAPPLFPLS